MEKAETMSKVVRPETVERGSTGAIIMLTVYS
jgi:hypothetical protein